MAGSGTPTTVASSTSLPSLGEALFARGDGTVLISDGGGSAAVSPGGSFHKLSFRGPGVRRGDVPIALGFLRSGGAAYAVRGTGIFASGRGLGGRLRLMRGSRRALSPKGKIAGVVRQLVASDGSIISEVHYGIGRIVSVRFERYDPRNGRTTTIVQGGPI